MIEVIFAAKKAGKLGFVTKAGIGKSGQKSDCKKSDQKKIRVPLIHTTRVARWFVFKPKIQIWVNFGGSCNGICWHILWTLGPFYDLLLHFMDI
jgi:hypothetical protein